MPDDRSNVVKRVWLTRKTRPGVSSHVIPNPGHPTPRRWKSLLPPSFVGSWCEVGVPRNFFLAMGLGDFLHLGTPGTCTRRQQA